MKRVTPTASRNWETAFADEQHDDPKGDVEERFDAEDALQKFHGCLGVK
jgi:hypothetical protein